MILGLGVDLVEVARIARLLEKYPHRFLQKILTASEQEFILQKAEKAQRVAAFFAAKEACSKALGTGLRGISWQEMEVRHQPSGKPELFLSGQARKRFLALGAQRIYLSLSHERNYAVAVVMIEGEGR